MNKNISNFVDNFLTLQDAFFDYTTSTTSDTSIVKNYHLSKNEDDSYLLEVPLPGYSSDDIVISVESDILTLSYEGEETRWKKEFKQKLRLKAEVNMKTITAEYKNGILELTLPIKKESKSRTIKVK